MTSLKTKGITLTELLVAGILMGIVMIGVIAVSFAIKAMQETTNKSALLAMRTTAVVTHMTRNVGMAVGYQDNPGIVVDGDADEQWVSVRQEDGGDVSSFDDDKWFIYRYVLDASELYVCEQAASKGPDPQNPDCLDKNSDLLASNVQEAAFTLSSDPEAYQFYLDVHLKMIYSSGTEDPVNNPSLTIDSRMSPAGHSW